MSKATDIYDLFYHSIDAVNESPVVHRRLSKITGGYDKTGDDKIDAENKLAFQQGMALAHTTSVATVLMMMEAGEEKTKLLKMIVDTLNNEDASIINNWFEQNKDKN